MPTKPREDWRSRALRAEGVILELRAALNAAEARAEALEALLRDVEQWLTWTPQTNQTRGLLADIRAQGPNSESLENLPL